SFPLALATIIVVRRGRRRARLTTPVTIITPDEPLSVADSTGSIPIIATDGDAAVGDTIEIDHVGVSDALPIIPVGSAPSEVSETGTVAVIDTEPITPMLRSAPATVSADPNPTDRIPVLA